ncbi:MAG: PDZ domain-containing protein [Acidimicrobiales bacterium]
MLAVVGVIGLTLIVGTSVTVPYFAISPGAARPTETLVAVDGSETFPSDGELLFTTVHIERMNLLDYGRDRLGLLPDSWEVLTEDEYLGPHSEEENDELNAQLMASSKDAAAYVALDHLGYDVSVSGTGAVITEIVEDTPAAAVLSVGDTIVGIDDQPITLTEEVAQVIGNHRPGDTVTLRLDKPDGTLADVQVTLASRPDDAEAGFLGVGSATRELEFNLPFGVVIDSGNVGGPSAGLAFTLAILDVLTPGELTGGDLVAVTGTINPDGTVGPVGGVAQKVAAAAEAGVEVVLVPAGELEGAEDVAGDDIRVEPVEDLDDALAALAELGGNALALPIQPGA